MLDGDAATQCGDAVDVALADRLGVVLPALIAGTGLGILPEFLLGDALKSKRLERVLPDWSVPLASVYWVTPPEGPLPKRVEVLGEFLTRKLGDTAESRRRA